MIYYSLGLITSSIVFAIFFSLLRTSANGEYLWVVLFSITLLSAAASLIFLGGLVWRLTQTIRQRNQTDERQEPLSFTTASRPAQPLTQPSTSQVPLSRSEFAQYWIEPDDRPSEEINRHSIHGGEAIKHWLEGEIEKRAPKETKPDAHQLPGFERIKRH